MSDVQPPPDSGDEAFWYDFLTVGSPSERRNRRILPGHGSPNCPSTDTGTSLGEHCGKRGMSD